MFCEVNYDIQEFYFSNWGKSRELAFWKERMRGAYTKLHQSHVPDLPWGTKFCRVAPNICGHSVANWLHVTILAPCILKWLTDFYTIWGTHCHRVTTQLQLINIIIHGFFPLSGVDPRNLLPVAWLLCQLCYRWSHNLTWCVVTNLVKKFFS